MNTGCLCALQGFRVASRKRCREERAFPRQSKQPGKERGGGGFTKAALRASQSRRRVNSGSNHWKNRNSDHEGW